MKSLIAGAVLVLAAGPALAQTTVTYTFTPAEQAQIHQYVVQEHIRSVPPPPGVTVEEGAVLPPTVRLYAFPTNVHWSRYRYSVIGNETVLVDPATRHIIEILR